MDSIFSLNVKVFPLKERGNTLKLACLGHMTHQEHCFWAKKSRVIENDPAFGNEPLF